MSKPKFILEKYTYKGSPVITIHFEKNWEVIRLLKNKFNAKWSAGLKLWLVPNTIENFRNLRKELQVYGYVDFKHIISEEEAKIYPIPKPIVQETKSELKQTLAEFERYLTNQRYSNNTIKTYTDALRVFFKYFEEKNPMEINNEDFKNFLQNYIIKKGHSASYQNQIINGIKLYYGKIRNSKLDIEKIERPRREHKLPKVLSKEEVKKLIDAHHNPKHKMMLSMIYACGLRRSELLNLSIKDIHSDRKILTIRNAKGKKDRIVPLSDKLLAQLRDYYKQYRPKNHLFEGINGQKYAEKSLENVLKQAAAKANIKRPVTLHWLRHSYATHLLESGTDLRYIQELLGHKNSKTTEIYTYVSTKNLTQIKSPFDDL